MPSDVKVNITDAAVISALNTPGGAVFEWRDQVMDAIVADAFSHSPVNNPLNAVHRGGVVGVFKASWRADRVGSNQHRVRARIRNTADHAVFVEEGRSASQAVQIFSWTKWNGEIRQVGGNRRGTSARAGKHILRDATNRQMAAQGLGGVT